MREWASIASVSQINTNEGTAYLRQAALRGRKR